MARFDGGWIKIYRGLLDSDIGENAIRFTLFSHLIAMANVEDTWVDWQGLPRRCRRGSLVTSVRELAGRVGASRGSIERHLKYLAKRESIIYEAETLGSFITINNYSDYQDNKTRRGHGSDTDEDTTVDTSEDTGRASIEELKNIRTKELKNISSTTVLDTSKSLALVKPTEEFNPKTEEELINAIPQKTKDRWSRLYADSDFIYRETLKAFNYYDNNPRKLPKSVRGWISALSSWFDRGWKNHVRQIESNRAVGYSNREIKEIIGGRK